MKLLVRLFLIVLLVGVLTFVTAGIAVAGSVVHSGVMSVAVDERGPDGMSLYIPIPAALMNLGLTVMPRFLPEEELAEMRREIQPWAPALKAVSREIADSPSMTFVRVDSADETVEVRKTGRYILVSVDSPDADIQVKIPANTFYRVIDALDG